MLDAPHAEMDEVGGRQAGREAVATIVPFHGSRAEAESAVAALADLDVGPDDEIVLVDNTRDGVAAGLDVATVRVLPAPAQQSSYHARNVGVLATRAAWLLFVDADCRPRRDLLRRYFEPAPEAGTGLVAGRVVGARDQQGFVAEYSRSRAVLDQDDHLDHTYLPFANTSNLLVRRRALEEIGGFHEGIRSGGDVDACWRLQQAGWALEVRPEAIVEHLHRERVRALARQMLRYGAGHAWLARRHPGAFPRHRVAGIVFRALAGAGALVVLGKPQRASFRLLDALHHAALAAGYQLGNDVPPTAVAERPAPVDQLRIAILASQFPQLSETFVVNEAQALQRLGHAVRVESRGRGSVPALGATHGLRTAYMEDDRPLRKARDLVRLVARHPVACLRDVWLRRELAPEDTVVPLRTLAPVAARLRGAGVRHLHVHFADAAATDGMRLARILRVPWSLTAHAYDIYQHPRNLRRKLAAATFVTSGCQYTVDDLRDLMPAGRRDDVHVVVMGVDVSRFRRTRPHPGVAQVLAVGRLVEKKGFAHLLDALALPGGDAVARLVVVGDGPLRDELRERATSNGVDDRVTFAGVRSPSEIRELLEESAVLAMPCVVAADGDRDSMPVVVKEALAMEVPVVASDEVGLPELVSDAWGRLVPPGDPVALARALGDLLALPAAQRAAMGAAGRRHVQAACSVDHEARRLAELIAAASTDRRT